MKKFAILILSLIALAGCTVETAQPACDTPTTPVEPPPVDTTPGLALPAQLQISPDFTPEEQEGILLAVSAWKTATNGAADVTPYVGSDPDAPCQINPVDAFYPEEVHRAGRTTASGIHCNIQLATSVIELVSKRKTWVSETQSFRYEKGITGVTRVFALKQLGTAFGIGMLDSGLMSEFYSETDDLDTASVEAFCSVRGCPNGTSTVE